MYSKDSTVIFFGDATALWTDLSLSLLHHKHAIITDADECKEKKNKVCGGLAECKNTVGSFECICPKGFTFDAGDKKCYGKHDIK